MFQIFTDSSRYTQTFPFVPTTMTFIYSSTARTPPCMTQPILLRINFIHQWLTSKYLKLNPTKTEATFLHVPLRSSRKVDPPSLNHPHLTKHDYFLESFDYNNYNNLLFNLHAYKLIKL